jgi:DNA helicase-2/ATP-dependent DNA helicase PcrA
MSTVLTRARTPDLRGLQVRTLNAIALAVVNGSSPFAPQPRQWQTIDEGEVRRIIGRLVNFPRKRNADPVATWIEALSMARLGLRSPDQVESVYDGDVDGFADVFPRYRRELERAGMVDFDEQVQRAIEVLLRDPVARAAAQRACRVMLVDEFQDLTPAHLLLVRLLAGPDAAVFGVGDDDQTIYGYNGADPAWLIDFATLFPGAGEHPLEVNYRCPADVVAAADMLLRHNQRRVAKVIRPSKSILGLTVEDGDAPVGTTVRVISEAVAAGTPTSDIAVLTRVNSMLVPVQVALHAAGVGTSGGVGREFLDRVAVRAALAWLRLVTAKGAFRAEDIGEALRRPSRSMHPNVANWVGEQTTVDGIRRLADRVNTERDAQRVREFADDIERLRGIAATRGTTGAILGALRDSMGLASSIATLDANRKGMNRTAQSDDLTAIAQLAELHPDPGTFERWLRDSVSASWTAGGVTLATVHRVKGQEWPFVVVHHAEADQFPHSNARRVHEFENRPITQAACAGRFGGGEKPANLIAGQKLRQLARTLGAAQRLGRIGGHPALPLTEGIEAARAGQLAGHARGRIAGGMQARGESTQDHTGSLSGVPTSGRAEEFLQLPEVLAIALERQRRRPALGGQKPEKPLDLRRETISRCRRMRCHRKGSGRAVGAGYEAVATAVGCAPADLLPQHRGVVPGKAQVRI